MQFALSPAVESSLLAFKSLTKKTDFFLSLLNTRVRRETAEFNQ